MCSRWFCCRVIKRLTWAPAGIIIQPQTSIPSHWFHPLLSLLCLSLLESIKYLRWSLFKFQLDWANNEMMATPQWNACPNKFFFTGSSSFLCHHLGAPGPSSWDRSQAGQSGELLDMVAENLKSHTTALFGFRLLYQTDIVPFNENVNISG